MADNFPYTTHPTRVGTNRQPPRYTRQEGNAFARLGLLASTPTQDQFLPEQKKTPPAESPKTGSWFTLPARQALSVPINSSILQGFPVNSLKRRSNLSPFQKPGLGPSQPKSSIGGSTKKPFVIDTSQLENLGSLVRPAPSGDNFWETIWDSDASFRRRIGHAAAIGLPSLGVIGLVIAGVATQRGKTAKILAKAEPALQEVLEKETKALEEAAPEVEEEIEEKVEQEVSKPSGGMGGNPNWGDSRTRETPKPTEPPKPKGTSKTKGASKTGKPSGSSDTFNSEEYGLPAFTLGRGPLSFRSAQTPYVLSPDVEIPVGIMKNVVAKGKTSVYKGKDWLLCAYKDTHPEGFIGDPNTLTQYGKDLLALMDIQDLPALLPYEQNAFALTLAYMKGPGNVDADETMIRQAYAYVKKMGADGLLPLKSEKPRPPLDELKALIPHTSEGDFENKITQTVRKGLANKEDPDAGAVNEVTDIGLDGFLLRTNIGVRELPNHSKMVIKKSPDGISGQYGGEVLTFEVPLDKINLQEGPKYIAIIKDVGGGLKISTIARKIEAAANHRDALNRPDASQEIKDYWNWVHNAQQTGYETFFAHGMVNGKTKIFINRADVYTLLPDGTEVVKPEIKINTTLPDGSKGLTTGINVEFDSTRKTVRRILARLLEKAEQPGPVGEKAKNDIRTILAYQRDVLYFYHIQLPATEFQAHVNMRRDLRALESVPEYQTDASWENHQLWAGKITPSGKVLAPGDVTAYDLLILGKDKEKLLQQQSNLGPEFDTRYDSALGLGYFSIPDAMLPDLIYVPELGKKVDIRRLIMHFKKQGLFRQGAVKRAVKSDALGSKPEINLLTDKKFDILDNLDKRTHGRLKQDLIGKPVIVQTPEGPKQKIKRYTNEEISFKTGGFTPLLPKHPFDRPLRVIGISPDNGQVVEAQLERLRQEGYSLNDFEQYVRNLPSEAESLPDFIARVEKRIGRPLEFFKTHSQADVESLMQPQHSPQLVEYAARRNRAHDAILIALQARSGNPYLTQPEPLRELIESLRTPEGLLQVFCAVENGPGGRNALERLTAILGSSPENTAAYHQLDLYLNSPSVNSP